jgi:hypothetical protein
MVSDRANASRSGLSAEAYFLPPTLPAPVVIGYTAGYRGVGRDRDVRDLVDWHAEPRSVMGKMKSAVSSLIVLASVLLAQSALATTFYVDSSAGSDGNAGTSRTAAWKSWGKMIGAFNAQTIRPGDTVLIRPGRYLASEAGAATWRLNGPGGTASSPITVSIDTQYTGDVEVLGALPGGRSGQTSAWTPAKKCAGGQNQNVPCDSDATCPGSTCAAVPGVYWTAITGSYMSSANGIGMAFQPNATPGQPPKLYEILYAPESAPIQMPSFTSGRNQCWPYFEQARSNSSNVCSAARVPFACCTGPGSGTCNNSRRMYVQTASGAAPNAVSPEVHIVYESILQLGFTPVAGPTKYIYFTNNNDGRTFHFWWSDGDNITVSDAHHIRFEDFDIAYNSTMRTIAGTSTANPWVDSGSAFPRDNSGPMYLVFQQAPSGGREVHHIEYRRGKIHKSAGDEAWHIDGGSPVVGGACSSVANCVADASLGTLFDCAGGRCQYLPTNLSGSNTIEDVEIFDQPWAVPNGNTSLYGYAYSWPPAGYRPQWASIYATHFSPLGGGGQSPGPWIISAQNNVIRRVNVHDSMSAQFESIYAIGNTVEDSRFDFTLLKYAGNANTASNTHPTSPVGPCNGGPLGACGGFGGDRGLTSPATAPGTVPQQGNRFRNNTFVSCYNACFVTGCCGGTLVGRQSGPQLVNNTFQLAGDGLYVGPGDGAQILIGDGWGTAANKAVIKNNIVTRMNPSSSETFEVRGSTTGTVVLDNNLWGNNMRWRWGNSGATTSFATWRSNVQGSVGGAEANSLTAGDPLFVSLSDMHIQLGSPAKDAGADLSTLGFSADAEGHTRPQGPRWDIGANEFQTGGPTPPSPPLLLSLEPVP